MFGFFIDNQLNTDDKKLYQKVIDFYKKRIRLESSKTYFEVCFKHNIWHFTNSCMYVCMHEYVCMYIFILMLFHIIYY